LHDGCVLALHAGITKRSKRLCWFGEKSLLEVLIEPRPGYNSSPIPGPDFFLVGLDQKIDRRRIDITLLMENTFEGADAEFHFRQVGAFVIVVVFMRHAITVIELARSAKTLAFVPRA